MTAESLPRQSKFRYRAAANSCPLIFSPPIPFSTPWISLRSSFLPLYHPLFTPRPRWHLPGAPAFSQGSLCCSSRVGARGFMVHIHQHHMPGFMGDGVQTWLLWISLAEADLWAVVGYNGWASFHPTPTSIHLLYVSFGLSCPQPYATVLSPCLTPLPSPQSSHVLAFVDLGHSFKHNGNSAVRHE